MGCGETTSVGDTGTVDMDSGPRDSGVGIDAAGDPIDGGSTGDGGWDAGGDGGGDAGADSGTSSLTCTATMACTGGTICVGGPGCEPAWSCIDSGIACTDDLVEYCGCDGTVFRDSSTCPTRPFAYMGACAGSSGFNCDSSTVRCRVPEPTCPDGQVPEVMGSCWTFRCVPLMECACTSGEQCPGTARCDAAAMRCQAG